MNIIEQIIAAKNGDKQFVLTNAKRGKWCAAIGNTSQFVAIGEAIGYGDSEAEFIAYGTSADEALSALLEKVLAG